MGGDGDGPPPDEHPPNYDWIIGIALMFIGSICTNLGNNLMSLGHLQQRELDRVRSLSDPQTPISTPGVIVRKTLAPKDNIDTPSEVVAVTSAKTNNNKTATPVVDMEAPLDIAQVKPKKVFERLPSYGERPISGGKTGNYIYFFFLKQKKKL